MLILALPVALAAATVRTPGPCDLLDRTAATQLLGQPVTSLTPSGPEPDEDTGGTRTVCVYQAGMRMLILTRVAFPTAAAARAAMTAELVGERLAEDGVTVKEESGLGDKAYWAQSANAAEYIVLKGPTALGIALGATPQEQQSFHASLRSAAKAVTEKL